MLTYRANPYYRHTWFLHEYRLRAKLFRYRGRLFERRAQLAHNILSCPVVVYVQSANFSLSIQFLDAKSPCYLTLGEGVLA